MLAPGVLWVAFSFAGVLAMSRAFVAEKEEGCLDALLLCPVSRDSLYFGKMLAMFLFMMVIEAALLPIFAVFFDFSAFSLTLLGAMVLATLGFATVGTLFAAVAAQRTVAGDNAAYTILPAGVSGDNRRRGDL